MIVHLRPRSSAIQTCDREIAQCRWMPLKEFLAHELVHDTNKHFARKFLEGREAGVAIARSEIEIKFKNFVRMQQIYSIKKRQSGDTEK